MDDAVPRSPFVVFRLGHHSYRHHCIVQLGSRINEYGAHIKVDPEEIKVVKKDRDREVTKVFKKNREEFQKNLEEIKAAKKDRDRDWDWDREMTKVLQKNREEINKVLRKHSDLEERQKHSDLEEIKKASQKHLEDLEEIKQKHRKDMQKIKRAKQKNRQKHWEDLEEIKQKHRENVEEIKKANQKYLEESQKHREEGIKVDPVVIKKDLEEIKLDRENIKKDGEEVKFDRENIKVEDYELHFNTPPGGSYIEWLFCSPTSCIEDLYIVPKWRPRFREENVKPLYGYKFNFSTGSFGPIKAPMASPYHGFVLNVKGNIFFVGHDETDETNDYDYWHEPLMFVFQCYDHHRNSWKALDPIPDFNVGQDMIIATAVWGDTILFNVDSCNIWAYDTSGKKWYPVTVKNKRCYDIIGEAIVLGDTIYALTTLSSSYFGSVVALNIKKIVNDDVEFEFDLRSDYKLPDLVPFFFKRETAKSGRRHLVHLGSDKFCLVHSCGFFGYIYMYHPIQVTYMRINEKENSLTVMGKCIYWLDIPQDTIFNVTSAFSVPESKTSALKEGKRLVFDFKPFGEGNTIYVRKLPRKAKVSQLMDALEQFGSIKSEGIYLHKNKEGKCFAYVEFETTRAKLGALQASTINIGGGCQAEILDVKKRPHSRALGKKKFRNHGEVSLSKTTGGGHNGGEGFSSITAF